MIEVEGSLWHYRDDSAGAARADALVIPTNGSINARGHAVMGRGLAKQAAALYPGIDQVLAYLLKARGHHVHVMLVTPPLPALVSFPVKHCWSDQADLTLIDQSCQELWALTTVMRWSLVALPRVGCGNGHRQWGEVRPRLSQLDSRFVVVYMEGYD